MKLRIKKIAPLQAAKMLAALYGLACVIIVPVLLAMTLIGGREKAMPLGAILAFPLLYVLAGFLVGLVGGFLYNVVAEMIGGIEVTLEQQA